MKHLIQKYQNPLWVVGSFLLPFVGWLLTDRVSILLLLPALVVIHEWASKIRDRFDPGSPDKNTGIKHILSKYKLWVLILIFAVPIGWFYLRNYRLEYCQIKYSISESTKDSQSKDRPSLGEIFGEPLAPKTNYKADSRTFRQQCLDEPLWNFIFK